MSIALKGDVLFLHIPKTGGTWLRVLMQQEGLALGYVSHEHATWDHVASQRGRLLRRLIKRVTPGARRLSTRPRVFCVVRHPIAWYESWFKYQSREDWPDRGATGDLAAWHVSSDLNGMRGADINAFISAVNARCPGYVSQLYARYLNNSGARWLRNEDLVEEFAALAREWRLEISEEAIRAAPRQNVSAKGALDWDPEVLTQTLAYERPALDRFGYDARGLA